MWLKSLLRPLISSEVRGFLFKEKAMIEISYHNVMNGLNKDLNMRLVLWDMNQTKAFFNRVCDLWYIEGFTTIDKRSFSLRYGPDKIIIQCISFNPIRNINNYGFKGIFMIHPDIHMDILTHSEHQSIQVIAAHNERYLDQWRA